MSEEMGLAGKFYINEFLIEAYAARYKVSKDFFVLNPEMVTAEDDEVVTKLLFNRADLLEKMGKAAVGKGGKLTLVEY